MEVYDDTIVDILAEHTACNNVWVLDEQLLLIKVDMQAWISCVIWDSDTLISSKYRTVQVVCTCVLAQEQQANRIKRRRRRRRCCTCRNSSSCRRR